MIIRAFHKLLPIVLLPAVVWLSPTQSSSALAGDLVIDTFKRTQLTDAYFSEGIGVGDLNHDGKTDVVYGPLWFAGPSFTEKHEIYPAKPQNKERYADHFFAWVRDFNGDGWDDVLTAGFPGTPAFLYENPKAAGHERPWPKHQVLAQVCNESPHFTNITGDATPELVCSNAGFFGYASFDASNPFEPWTFHAVSEKVAPVPFGHGLGVGDVDGDGRMDLLTQHGWFRQPESLEGSPKWKFHSAPFAPIGGADIHVYDVDGDGDGDVITSLAAHDFGLAWYEQIREDGKISFRRHLIMGDRPGRNRYGLVFSEPHSVILADIDGDGLKDIVTGKTYYSHHKQSPMWDAGAVVYWFRLSRGKDGVDWVPYKADGEAGIGRQLVAADIDGDGLVDLASGGMKGAHVLTHLREKTDEARYREFQPKPRTETDKPRPSGPKAAIDTQTGRVVGAIEAETMRVASASAGKTSRQKMNAFLTGEWSGGEQLVWSGAKPGDRLVLEFDLAEAGVRDIAAALTLARDYAVVKLSLDDRPLGEPLDLYEYPDVLATGEIPLGSRDLAAGTHRLSIEIVGANPSALRSFMVGVDYIRPAAR